MKRTPVTLASTAAAALLLVGCVTQEPDEPGDSPAAPAPAQTAPEVDAPDESPDEGEDSEESDAAGSAADESRPDGVVVEATFIPHYSRPNSEVTLQATVGPFTRDGDLAALPMEFEYSDGEEDLSTMNFLFGLVGITDGTSAGGQVRLIDHAERTVAELARLEDGEGPVAVLSGSSAEDTSGHAAPGESLQWLGVFDAPESDTVSVLLPNFGLISGIPVQEGDLSDVHIEGETFDAADISGETLDLVTWRESPNYAVTVEGEETTVSLPSDVLFDVDSAELSDEANAALQAAAAEMQATEGGELQIVGHTDNVLDEDYNQQLSEQRAEAVQQRLAELVDLDAFDEVSVSGESFRQPIAENSSEAGRALNRRVELQFTTVAATELRFEQQELPEPQGPVAGADEQLTVQAEQGPHTGEHVILTVDSLTRHDGLLVAGIRAESTAVDGSIDWPFLLGAGGAHRAGVSQVGVVDLPYLVAGDQWIEPLRYVVTDAELDEEDPEGSEITGSDYRKLSTTLFGMYQTYDEGDSAVAYLVYPDVDAEELTLESPGEYEGTDWLLRQIGLNPWRFENVPVEDGSR